MVGWLVVFYERPFSHMCTLQRMYPICLFSSWLSFQRLCRLLWGFIKGYLTWLIAVQNLVGIDAVVLIIFSFPSVLCFVMECCVDEMSSEHAATDVDWVYISISINPPQPGGTSRGLLQWWWLEHCLNDPVVIFRVHACHMPKQGEQGGKLEDTCRFPDCSVGSMSGIRGPEHL